MPGFEPLAIEIARLLTSRGETIAVAESSAGGLISAALLAVPGASAFFLGGAVVYTRLSRSVLLGIPDAALDGMRPATEPYAQLLARTARERFGATDVDIAGKGHSGHCCGFGHRGSVHQGGGVAGDIKATRR